MYHLTLRTEYSFKKCFGFLKELHDDYSHNDVIGIADDNTLGFYKLFELCKKSGKKAIYGLRVTVVKDATLKVKPRGQFGKEYIIIARNYEGLQEIFKLTSIQTNKEAGNYYYRGNIGVCDIESLTGNVFVISTDPITERLDFIGINHTTRPIVNAYKWPKVYVDNNNYTTNKMRKIYELAAGNSAEKKTYPQHVLYRDEIRGFGDECINNLQIIVDGCENIEMKKAQNIEYKGDRNIFDLCYEGAVNKGIEITDPVYAERYEKEIKLIEDKGYTDYLLVVADLINSAKKFCLVGGGRGSSAGSLVCYLLNITEIDPIKHGLIFERFIDINRYDPPDVDTDFPDNARLKVTRYLEKIYGKANVKTMSTISKWKPKVTIGEFAKHMDIPRFETEAVKDVIIERAGGDARASYCLEDTLNGTDVGKEFLENFPNMINVKYIEGHAKQKGKHAAGIIVCNEPIVEYCGIDERDGTALIDKKDAEKLNLLKIDVLGLRTLSVLQDCAKAIGMHYKEYYKLPLDDPDAYKIFQERRLGGIFQFEGEAMKSINDSAPMEKFADVVAAGALGRPGALSSGGTSRYVQLRSGNREPLYYCPKHKKITEETYGIVIYQEQMMFLCRDIAGMTWEDVSDLRKAASKSLGEEFFEKYRIKFVEGAMKLSGYEEETANKAWLDISSMGSYAFNKSHSVVYGQISYWTAYMKAHYPIEFIASILNNSKDDDSSLKILREFYEAENLVFKAVDPYKSNTKWEIIDGTLLGGLTNIKGIGSMKALDMIKVRNGKKPMTPAMKAHFDHPRTPFDILYPCKHHFGDMYDNPLDYGVTKMSYIKDVDKSGEYAIIGKMVTMDDNCVNDVQSIAKRGGELLDGPDMKVHLRLEDDTGVMMCILNRFIYQKLSQEFLREKIGATWYCLIGKVMPGAKILFIKEVANLNQQIGLNESEEQR